MFILKVQEMIGMKRNSWYLKTLYLHDEFLIFPRESNKSHKQVNVTKNT